ncbi:hypothetical protein FACS1894200_02760 [Spirochaetia bacterium]|nr:hypothetical protein FACS1894200_02760 [Spirochaetia bacterium]
MKRIVCTVLLAASLAAGVSAQSKTAIGLDIMPLFKGFIWADTDANNSLFALSPSFEYLVAPSFTMGGAADLWFGKASDISVFYFGLNAQGRWYPLSEGLDKLFVGTTLGFNRLAVDGKTEAQYGGFFGLTIGLKMGYRLIFDSFFVEPSMAFVYSKTGQSVPTPSGWQPGLSLGLTF